ncbi:hypothetical protein EKO27_g7754 [Xylaria grammica]|uniref:DUF2828 domain-containing protein n=1 Tax=Xylaria grammica TaxID=363999 RepID=A0A439CZC8_9PEZI|nr:hypothetical protein EKO27_g7754 [Xylaria grammica]
MATATEHQELWYLRSNRPVLFPTHDGFDLSKSQSAFDALVRDIVRSTDIAQVEDAKEAKDDETDKDDSFTLVSASTTQEARGALVQLDLATATEGRTEVSIAEPTLGSVAEPAAAESDKPNESNHPFIQGLLSMSEEEMRNRMLTEKGDVAYRSTTSALVDLFTELEDVVSGPRLLELLNAAWKDDPLATLKIIFNARSIHLGKASRVTFYRCAGWLASYHPLTLIANLRWLSRPVIQKKVQKEDADAEIVVVDVSPEKDADDVTRFDVKYGVSHGYWKDLLNILVLGVEGNLNVLVHPNTILYVAEQKSRGKVNKGAAKALRHEKRHKRHDDAVATFNSSPTYRGLYLTVARLFAEQLKIDSAILRSEDPKAKKGISLCAKWAPSDNRFHDKHTFVVSSIAEMLHPMAGYSTSMDRELYLRHAREDYRKDMSALRAHLDIVERNLSAKTYDQIKYDRVPSLAMSNYSKIFSKRDRERFEEYLNGVAEGKARISGATLLPSTLIRPLRESITSFMRPVGDLAAKVSDMQWKTLVQRIKDSGTLESSIAVCDVSSSMEHPMFSDRTVPIDSAIGLSLLVAEVTAPPFGGHFITFSSRPKVETVDLSKSLRDKVDQLSQSHWSMNTDFVAVFEKLILPMAVENQLSQEQMVKRVFVFSDMQFDEAERYRPATRRSEAFTPPSFKSSYERIKTQYAAAGYDMPELIFWNLAGGRAGFGRGTDGDPTAPKPVTADEAGTTMVSGYSQAMLKLFLDGGSFDDPASEDDEGDVETTEEDGAVVVESKARAKKRKLDPMSMVKKAISHKSYDPLVVMD